MEKLTNTEIEILTETYEHHLTVCKSHHNNNLKLGLDESKKLYDLSKSLQEKEKITALKELIFFLMQNKQFNNADHFVLELVNLLQNPEILEIYSWYGMCLYDIQEYEKSLLYHRKAKEKAIENCNEKRASDLMNNIGILLNLLGRFEEAFDEFTKALDFFEKNDFIFGQSVVNMSFGNYFYAKSDFETSLEYYLKAYSLKEKLNEKPAISMLQNNIGNIYKELENFDKAIEFYEKSLLISKELNNEKSIALKYNNLANIYKAKQNYLKAEKFYNKSFSIYSNLNFSADQAMVLNNLGTLKSIQNDLNEAVCYYLKAAEIRRLNNNYHGLSNTLNNLAIEFLKQKNYDKAQKILNESLEYCEKYNYEDIKLKVLKTQISYFKEIKNYKEAFDRLNNYNTIKANFDKKKFSKKMLTTFSKFELKEKEREKEIYRLKAIDLKKKNETIAIQKRELEKTLNELKQSEIKYEYTNKQLKEKIGTVIIGESAEIKNVITLIKKVSQTNKTSILITGETGTGKELVARAIHDHSKRKSNNFCPVNVSAIPESLFDSEFFGYTKNAFTGALKDKQGWFSIANNGTLFLDEIGTLDLNLQSKFLRVLENQTFIPLGSSNEYLTDLRIISATNNNLSDLINENSFRLDLYHRLSTFIINLPPLRERKIDIPILFEFFVKKFSLEFGKKITQIEPDLLRALQDYNFPGNIRELKNMIERAIIICNSSKLKLKDFNILPKKINNLEIIPLETLERNMVIKALETTNYHQANAAKLLKINAKSLKRRMIKYEITKAK